MFQHFRPRVLLADDYVRLFPVLTQLLEPTCDVVGQVPNGLRLLEAVTLLQPDVIVVDAGLPDVDGFEACRQIRAATPHTKVVVFTAADDPALRRRALDVGASAFVLKYHAADDLLPAVLMAFGQQQVH